MSVQYDLDVGVDEGRLKRGSECLTLAAGSARRNVGSGGVHLNVDFGLTKK